MFVRALVVLLFAFPLSAKTLSWNAIDVEARLDRDGNLHVVETQEMVLDGDWNGGERSFDLRARQELDVEKIVRIDGTAEVPLTRGELDQVDRWDYASTSTVRWRSRMPSDPPFSNRTLTYRLHYKFSNILLSEEDRFRLDHDFGMPDREGDIRRFTLRLTFDPVWNAAPITLTRENLKPGESVPVDQPLTYAPGGFPAGVERPLAPWVPFAALLLFFGGAAFIVLRFLSAERAVGRFAPIVARFDDELLKLQPEVAGAVWDGSIGAPEVAAVLARMTQEGKLSTRTEGKTLHLKLEVPRTKLAGYERELIGKLFYDGSKETDTDSIRAHYSSRGFDPAAAIKEALEMKLDKLADWSTKEARFSMKIDVALLVAALLLLAISAFSGASDVFAAATGFAASGLFALLAAFAAVHYSKTITNVGAAMAGPSILMMVACAPLLIYCALAKEFGLHAPVLLALALWTLALMNLVFHLLRIRDTPGKIAYRKRIAGARQYFVEQLQRETPELRDEWFPYVLAFGLGNNVEKWFRSYGGETSHASSMSSSTWSSSSSSSSSSGWTGGGGAFGGAGASGTWAVAAGAMAAGVSAPSSSGSSGGSSGGSSSSGGGGGGGW